MGICWYCYWGWAKPVAEIYLEAVKKLSGNHRPLIFGPSHIVWEDENFDAVQRCLDNFDHWKGDFTDSDLEVVRWSLEELNKIPLDERDIIPEDYDEEHPELYPPKVEVIKMI